MFRDAENRFRFVIEIMWFYSGFPDFVQDWIGVSLEKVDDGSSGCDY